MSERNGYFTARIEREHYDTLFAGWRLRAWMDLNCDADFKTGVVRITEREMTLRWEASKGAVGRWLAELEEAGYVRSGLLGDTPRAGRYLVVIDVEERGKVWGKVWGKAGANGGAIRGAKKARQDVGDPDTRGANGGAIRGANVGQSLGHVVSKEKKQEVITTPVPSEPAGGAAPVEAEQVELVPMDASPAPRRQQAKTKATADPLSEGAQRVVAAFDAALRTAGWGGVASADWAAQRTMARNALKSGMPEGEAIQAIAWAMQVEWERRRLRTHRMKAIREVWVAWQERGRAPPLGKARRSNAYVDPAQQADQFKPDSPWGEAEVA